MGKCGVKKLMVYGIVFLGIGSTTLLQSHALSSHIVQCPLKCPCYGHSPGSKLTTPSFKMANLNIQKPQNGWFFSWFHMLNTPTAQPLKAGPPWSHPGPPLLAPPVGPPVLQWPARTNAGARCQHQRVAPAKAQGQGLTWEMGVTMVHHWSSHHSWWSILMGIDGIVVDLDRFSIFFS